MTLPLLLTLKRCEPAERERIATLLKSAARLAEISLSAPDDGSLEKLDVGPALELIARYRGVEDTVRRAEEHAAKAAAAIAPFADCRPKDDLLAAAVFSVQRDR